MPQTSRRKIVFPIDTDSIISEILEKHNLETNEEFFEKVMKGEKTEGGAMARLIKKAAEQEMSLKDLIFALKTEFNLSEKKATDLAQEIREKILLLAEEVLKKPSSAEKKLIEEKPSTTAEDIYREPIE